MEAVESRKDLRASGVSEKLANEGGQSKGQGSGVLDSWPRLSHTSLLPPDADLKAVAGEADVTDAEPHQRDGSEAKGKAKNDREGDSTISYGGIFYVVK